MNHRILAAISAVALVVTAPGCCRDNVVTIDMRDYGLSAATPENAAEKIIAAFDYCKSLDRPARIVLEKGTYDIRFDSGSIENPVLLTIDSMKDFTFDGGGSMLYFHGLTGLAGIINSENKRSEKYAVEDFTMIGEETFEMVLASPVPETAPDVVLYAENSERNPEVHIHDNRFGSGNRARGVLLTTPRKSVIENNVFESSGAAILIEGDISYWYESGGVTDVRISDNVFYHCATSPWGAAVITLTPSTDIPGYHSGVTISGNRFVMAPGVLPLYTVDSTAVNFLPDNIME